MIITTAASLQGPEQILKRSLKFALALSNNEMKATPLNHAKWSAILERIENISKVFRRGRTTQLRWYSDRHY